MTVHVTSSHDGLSFRGASAPVQLLIFADMLPRKWGTEGEQMGMAITQLRSARRGAMLQDGACDLRQQDKERLD